MIQKRTDQAAREARRNPGLRRRLAFFSILLGAALFWNGSLWALTVTPTVQQFDMKPGEKKKGTYLLTNDDTWDMQITPESKDWFTLPANKENKITAPDWLIVKGTTFTLKPGESREVPFEVRVPKLSTGEIMGMATFLMVGGPDKFVNKRFSVAVYVGIQGTMKASSKILAMSVDTSSPTFTGGFIMSNTGNIHLRPTGLIQVFDSKKVNMLNITIQRSSPIYPGERKAYTGEIPNFRLEPGEYTAEITVKDSDRDIEIPHVVKKFTVRKDRTIEAK